MTIIEFDDNGTSNLLTRINELNLRAANIRISNGLSGSNLSSVYRALGEADQSTLDIETSFRVYVHAIASIEKMLDRVEGKES